MTDDVDLQEYVPERCEGLLDTSNQELKSELPALARDKGRMGEIEKAVKSLPSHHEMYLGDARDVKAMI